MTAANQTAYPDRRKARSGAADRLSGWDPEIVRLFGAGHNFLGYGYSEPGWLYRGASRGLNEILRTSELGHFDGEQAVARLERELGVYLVSQDFSDAYSVARFWENSRDGYIAVFESAVFNRELHAGRAAVLGFAEPGVVFKYPFLTRPLALAAIDYLIVSPEDYAALDRADTGPALEPQTVRAPSNAVLTKIISPAIGLEFRQHRASFERALTDLLASRGISSAVAVASANFPGAR
jgi:hypothetical protein